MPGHNGLRHNGELAGAPYYYTNTLLFVLTGADMNSTSDQSFVRVGQFNGYLIQSIRQIWASGANGSTVAGGIYDAASKGGNVILAASTVYTSLTGAGKANTSGPAPGPTNNGSSILTNTPILSLTTPQGAAMTADFYIFGWRVN